MSATQNTIERESLNEEGTAKLSDLGLSADKWPIVKPWPEVQQYEARRMAEQPLYRHSTQTARQVEESLAEPISKASDGIELPWLETEWGALRLHPIAIDADDPSRLRAAIDLHLRVVRPRRHEAAAFLACLKEKFDDRYVTELKDGNDPLATGGVSFEGTQREIDKQFKRFCSLFDRGGLGWCVHDATVKHLYDEEALQLESACELGTSVDDLAHLVDGNPELFQRLERAATKLRAARTTENLAEHEQIVSLVEPHLCHYDPPPSAVALADAICEMRCGGDIKSMMMPGFARELRWPEVVAAESDSATKTTQSDWTDEHWLQSRWGVLRIRFHVVDGLVTEGSAQFLFREARYESVFDEIERVAALLLAQQFAMLPMRWHDEGQPIFLLGVNGTVDEDLKHLAAMIMGCYVEDITHSWLVLHRVRWHTFNAESLDDTFMRLVAEWNSRPLLSHRRSIASQVVAKKLAAGGLVTSSWPVVKPWPEVQRFELAEMRADAARMRGDDPDLDHPLADHLPSHAEAEHIVLPWIETSWGALRLHPLESCDEQNPKLLAAEIDFHWHFVRPRPHETELANDYSMERIDEALGGELTEGSHALSTAGVMFIGTEAQIRKKFAKFCRVVARGDLDRHVENGEQFLYWKNEIPVSYRFKKQGTCVDALFELATVKSQHYVGLLQAARRVALARTPENLAFHDSTRKDVETLCAGKYQMRYDPHPSSTAIAAALEDASREHRIDSMAMPNIDREMPWDEVLSEEAHQTANLASLGWTDDHWLQAKWGVLRLRFSVTDGKVNAGRAQFLFRESRFDGNFATRASAAAQMLTRRYPLLPGQWSWEQCAAPVFLLGMSGSLGDDLRHLAAMLRGCFVEDILYSRTVTKAFDLPPGCGGYGHGLLRFVANHPGSSTRNDTGAIIQLREALRDLRAALVTDLEIVNPVAKH